MNKNKKTRKNIMIGGKYLGEGSYGCVITPEIKCKLDRKVKSRLGVEYNNKSKKVSKIILKRTSNLRDELELSKLLLSIDPKQKYFITFLDYCNLNSVPKNRNNIVKVEFLDNKFKDYTSLESKKLSKKYCPIDLNFKPLNIIMEYGGYNLFEMSDFMNKHNNIIIKLLKSPINYSNYIVDFNKKINDELANANKSNLNKTKKIKDKIIENKMQFHNKIILSYQIITHFKKWFRHLLLGIYKLHQNNIINRDIKLDNLTAVYNSKNKQLQIRFIDFGLSEYLTPNFCNEDNISIAGTYDYIGPEIFIIYNLFTYNNRKTDAYIISAINEDIKENHKKFFKDMEINIPNLNDSIINLYKQLKNEINNDTLLNNYYGINNKLNGYLQKSDIYGLGTSIYEFLYITKIIDFQKDLRLMNLLKNMYEINVNKRYTILECINHPYFTN